MHVVVVQQGRIRDPHIIALRETYLTRFRRFGSLRVVEVDPVRPGRVWPASSRYRVLIDAGGRALDSVAFARELAAWSMHHGEIALLIGDADGHEPQARTQAHGAISLGPMILPHRIAHLVVVEQVYRAATILAGLPYHHQD